jgi:FHA domain
MSVAAQGTGPVATVACPSCATPNPSSNLFCESCGLDFVTGQAPAPDPVAASPSAAVAAAPVIVDPGTDLGWSAELTISSEWFAAKGEGIGVPPTRGPITIELRHDTVLIGRSRSTGTNPGVVIDDDHGISRRHAELRHDIATDSWTLTDLGSTNGSFVVADGEAITPATAPLPANEPRPITVSDRVFVGAWTQICVRKAISPI